MPDHVSGRALLPFNMLADSRWTGSEADPSLILHLGSTHFNNVAEARLDWEGLSFSVSPDSRAVWEPIRQRGYKMGFPHIGIRLRSPWCCSAS